MNTEQMTLTCCQDHLLTENIWFVWSETSYSGDERRCYRCGTNNNEHWKWLEAHLNLVEIKTPIGFFETCLKANDWWVPLFIYLEKGFFLKHPSAYILYRVYTNIL